MSTEGDGRPITCDGGIHVADATVDSAEAAKGVIQVIDRVLPPAAA